MFNIIENAFNRLSTYVQMAFDCDKDKAELYIGIGAIIIVGILSNIVFIFLANTIVNSGKKKEKNKQLLGQNIEEHKRRYWEVHGHEYMNKPDFQIKNEMIKMINAPRTRYVRYVVTYIISALCYMLTALILWGTLPFEVFAVIAIALLFIIATVLAKYKEQLDLPVKADTDEYFLYKYYFADKAVKKIFNDENAYYERDGKVYCPDTLPLHDHLQLKNFIYTNIENTPIYMGFFSCYKAIMDTVSEDIKYHDFCSGMMYAFPSKSHFPGHTRIFSTIKDTMGNEKVTSYHTFDPATEIKVETDNIWFNENFEVYTTSKVDALYFLSPEIIQILCEAKSHNIIYSICLDSDWIYVNTSDNTYSTNSIELKPDENYVRSLNVDFLAAKNKHIFEGAKKIYCTFNK